MKKIVLTISLLLITNSLICKEKPRTNDLDKDQKSKSTSQQTSSRRRKARLNLSKQPDDLDTFTKVEGTKAQLTLGQDINLTANQQAGLAELNTEFKAGSTESTDDKIKKVHDNEVTEAKFEKANYSYKNLTESK